MILHIRTQNLFSWSNPQFWGQTNLSEGFNTVASQDRRYPIGYQTDQNSNSYNIDGLLIDAGQSAILSFSEYEFSNPIFKLFNNDFDGLKLVLEFDYKCDGGELELYDSTGLINTYNSNVTEHVTYQKLITSQDDNFSFRSNFFSSIVSNINLYIMINDINFVDTTKNMQSKTELYNKIDGSQNNFGRLSNEIAVQFDTTIKKDVSNALFNLVETSFKYRAGLEFTTYKKPDNPVSWGLSSWGQNKWGRGAEITDYNNWVEGQLTSHSLDDLTNPCYSNFGMSLIFKSWDFYNAIKE